MYSAHFSHRVRKDIGYARAYAIKYASFNPLLKI